MDKIVSLDKMQLFLRLALAGAFLSAVADRFGLWGEGAVWGTMDNFVDYSLQVMNFLPTSLAKMGAYVATIAEIVFGILLIVGVKTRWVAFLSGVLLLSFAVSMSISFGVKVTFDYSVWTASAGAFLLATCKKFPYSIDQIWLK